MNTLPFAAIKIDKKEAQKRASEVMADIQKYRDDKKAQMPLEKQRLINKARKTLWNRIFHSNATDEYIFDAYERWEGRVSFWHYWDLKEESIRGFSKHYDACKKIVEMVELSSEDSIWITDEGYKFITSKIWYI